MSRIVDPEDTLAATREAARLRREGRTLTLSHAIDRWIGQKVFVWTLTYHWIGRLTAHYGEFIELTDCEFVYDHDESIKSRMAAGKTQLFNLSHVASWGPLADMPWGAGEAP